MWKQIKSWFSSETPEPEEPPPALGWDAITQAFQGHYGRPEAGHLAHNGVLAMHDLEQPPQYPLDGISLWDGGDMWHVVGFGMSELYGKDSDDPDVSGWGYELCLRLAKESTDEDPPVWPAQLLQSLCKAQWSLPPLEPGHTLRTGSVVEGSSVAGFLLVEDPDLGTIDTPHGRVTFLLVVGVDETQLDAAQGGKALEVFATLDHGGTTRF